MAKKTIKASDALTTGTGTAYGFTITYNKVGRVATVGIHTGTASSAIAKDTVIYTLPKGVRPVSVSTYPAMINGSFGTMQVTTAGEVKPTSTVPSGGNIRFLGAFICK